ncbi:hypothetical protein SAMN05192561_12616 [Halopenitus malekzadehii]|uniref:Ribbon-helix-helix protein, copG family n=1 Tax=Halopenitus malekzadehii TaxID=1267564 RepID=A0A1H6K620_9EURY|nr:hypothetical protein [Halopenitus malekzadehii]SEH66882.1 hypothetical protein SAMN05192561_12616 [Halopenitus malekzadehii]
MEHISLRVDESLLEAIDENRSEDVDRSKWLRRAAREKIDRPEPREEFEELREDLDDLERRIAVLEQ